MITVDFDRIRLRPETLVLDIGCGKGRHMAASHARQSVFSVGIDHRREDLIDARKRMILHERLGASAGGKWSLLQSDVNALPLHDETFDLVICSEVLEHLQSDGRAVREMLRVLKSGCPLVISVPRYWPERICWLLSREYRTAEGGHVKIYRKPALVQRVESFGAVYLGNHHAHSLHAPFWWLKCLVGIDRANHPLVDLYHRLLVWEMTKRPKLMRIVEKILNPAMGKSLVVYFKKRRPPYPA